jgi:hypothetical protein
MILKSHAFVYGNIVLDFHTVSDLSFWADHNILADLAVGSDFRPFQDMTEMPDARPWSDFSWFIRNSRGMNKKACSLRAIRESWTGFPFAQR